MTNPIVPPNNKLINGKFVMPNYQKYKKSKLVLIVVYTQSTKCMS